jgi:hypothetical protein
MRRLILATLAAIPFVLGATGSTTSPHNIFLSRFRTEPVVAIDPTTPSIVVAGANTNYIAQSNGTFPAPFFASHNGGASFIAGVTPMPSPYRTAADTSITVARDGTVFYSYLGESATYCSGGPGAVLLAHSVDHGLSYRGPVVVDSNPADDRPTVAVENFPGHPSHLFEAWTRSYPGRDEVWFARSVDGGAHFSPPLKLYSSGFLSFGAIPVVAPNGRIYVGWVSHANTNVQAPSTARVLLAASADDGAHFSPPHQVGHDYQTVPQRAVPGMLRDLSALSMAAAPSGALFISYAAVLNRNSDGSVDAAIVVRRSPDHGLTWSLPEFVNDASGGDRFMPALSVLSDGSVAVAFYDRRAGANELDVYAARASFVPQYEVSPNVRVNARPAPIADIPILSKGNFCLPPGRFFGDYIGAAADGDQLGVVWADTQRQAGNETDIWFARVSFAALAPPAAPTSGGRSIFSWFTGLAGRLHLSEGQLVALCIILLFPVMTAVIGIFSLVRQGKADEPS